MAAASPSNESKRSIPSLSSLSAASPMLNGGSGNGNHDTNSNHDPSMQQQPRYQMKEVIKNITSLNIDGIVALIMTYLPPLGVFMTSEPTLSRFLSISALNSTLYGANPCDDLMSRIWLIDSSDLPPRCVAIVV
jgi:hypothetical protein